MDGKMTAGGDRDGGSMAGGAGALADSPLRTCARPKKAEEFDEREVSVRGKVFFHGTLVLFALLILNAFLQGAGVVWASGFHQNIIIMCAGGSAITIELILRGVYFGRTYSPWWTIIPYSAIGVFAIAAAAVIAAHGGEYVADGKLTNDGFFLVIDVTIGIDGIVALIKTLADRRKDRE